MGKRRNEGRYSKVSSTFIKGVGIIIMFFGIACADSPSLAVPAALIAIGAVVYRRGERREG